MATMTRRESNLQQRVMAGVAGGLAGGLVFGMTMTMMGMMPMIASMVGSQSALVGWMIHILISAFIGATFGIIFGGASTSYGRLLGFGLLYGAMWWVLGPLLVMPSMLGMPLFMINGMTLMSLVGHLIFGAILGLVYAWYQQR